MQGTGNQDWTRLSIAELLLMTSCIGFGFAVSRGVDVARKAILGGLLIGMSMAGPAVFLYQAWRGRRTRLSGGEILWVTPIGLYLALCFSLITMETFQVTDTVVPVLLIIVSLAMLSIFALAVTLLGQAAAGGRRSIACQWTDIAGSVFAASAMAAIVYLVSQADIN